MARVVKLLISVVVFAIQWSVQSLRRVLGLRERTSAVVLYYHSVRDEERSRFAMQMDKLLAYCRPIPADSQPPFDPGKRYAAVTFDDGLQSVVKNALPELSKRHIPCTIFIIADALGKQADWITYKKQNGPREFVISAEQLHTLPRAGVTIGAHTLTHPKLTAIGLDLAKREIVESRAKLEKLLGREVRLFSFPYGDFDEQLVECCISAGFTRAFASLPGSAFAEPGEFLTGRVSVKPSDWRLEFRLKLLGAYSWLPLAIRSKESLPDKSTPPASVDCCD